MAIFGFSEWHEVVGIATRPWLWFRKGLELDSLAPHPMDQFARWYQEARAAWWRPFPNAMCLSTLDESGNPDARMVLLKGFDRIGFIFYTNANTVKGRFLNQHRTAALTFFWEIQQRQVRIKGSVECLSEEECNRYFATRPRQAQIGAWASLQSEVLPSRALLQERMQRYISEFAGRSVPRPPHWLGYRVRAQQVEFWQLRFSRLHDRFVYKKKSEDVWLITQLYP